MASTTIDEGSCECGREETDLFQIPPTQVDIVRTQFQPFNPLTSISSGGTIDFTVPGSGDMYIDPSMTYLYVKARMQRNGGGDELVGTEQCWPTNNLFHSLFSQVEVALNGTTVSSSSNIYPYRAYLETLLNYGGEAKRSQLRMVGWSKDETGKMDDLAQDGGKQRMTMLGKGSFELIGKLHADFFNTEPLLLNGVELKVKLTPSKDPFLFRATVATSTATATAIKPTLKLEECILYVRRVEISPATGLYHAKVMDGMNAIYPVNRVSTRAFTLAQGLQTTSLDNVYQGQLPTRIFIGFVLDKAFNGSYETNPYNFQNFDLNYLCIYVNGRANPMKPLTPNFKENLYLREYQALYASLGHHFGSADIDINYNDFAKGYCIFGFDLTPDLAAADTTHNSLTENGELRIDVRFGTALPDSVTCVVYGEFRNSIHISKERKVTTDFGS